MVSEVALLKWLKEQAQVDGLAAEKLYELGLMGEKQKGFLEGRRSQRDALLRAMQKGELDG